MKKVQGKRKPKAVCIICGGKDAPEHKLPHGTIHIHGNKCFKILCAKTQDSIPMVWAGIGDYTDHELYTDEELRGHDEALIDGADAATDYLWNGNFGDEFEEALKAGAVEVERALIREANPKELPLLIGNLKFPKENEGYLSRNIKEIS